MADVQGLDPFHIEIARVALATAADHGFALASVPDALYVVVARRLGVPVVTVMFVWVQTPGLGVHVLIVIVTCTVRRPPSRNDSG